VKSSFSSALRVVIQSSGYGFEDHDGD